MTISRCYLLLDGARRATAPVCKPDPQAFSVPFRRPPKSKMSQNRRPLPVCIHMAEVKIAGVRSWQAKLQVSMNDLSAIFPPAHTYPYVRAAIGEVNANSSTTRSTRRPYMHARACWAYRNADNGFYVLQVKVRRLRDLVTAVGHATIIHAGEFIQASGVWVNDKKLGPQFKATYLNASASVTAEGIRRYFASGMIKGIGPVCGQRSVAGFDRDVFQVIEHLHERHREVERAVANRYILLQAPSEDRAALKHRRRAPIGHCRLVLGHLGRRALRTVFWDAAESGSLSTKVKILNER